MMTLLNEIKGKFSPELLTVCDSQAIAAAVTEFDVRRAIWADDGSYLA